MKLKWKVGVFAVATSLVACNAQDAGSHLLDDDEQIDSYTEGCTLHERDTRYVERTELLSAYRESVAQELRAADPEIRAVGLKAISRAVGETVTMETLEDHVRYVDDLSIERLVHSRFPEQTLYAGNVGVGGGNGTYLTYRKDGEALVLVAETFDGDLLECAEQYHERNQPDPTDPPAQSYSIECYARGHSLRQMHADPTDLYTDSRLIINMNATDDQAVMTEYFGHVMAKYTWDSRGTEASEQEYYGHFRGQNKSSSLSPAARAYLDSEYYRFRDFDADMTSRMDGGGMWGYLVIQKSVREGGSANGHYVFRAGDHMGGTIDLTCSR